MPIYVPPEFSIIFSKSDEVTLVTKRISISLPFQLWFRQLFVLFYTCYQCLVNKMFSFIILLHFSCIPYSLAIFHVTLSSTESNAFSKYTKLLCVSSLSLLFVLFWTSAHICGWVWNLVWFSLNFCQLLLIFFGRDFHRDFNCNTKSPVIRIWLHCVYYYCVRWEFSLCFLLRSVDFPFFFY